MFWRFGFNNTSTIDSILEKENVTLEEVLLDQDIIQETKSQNSRLLEFLIKEENLVQLVELFFKLKSDEERLPFIACEILGCEVQRLIDAVIDHQDVFTTLWEFLKTPYSTDASYNIQASYFCKIMTSFLTKRTVDTICFIQSDSKYAEWLLSHLKSSAIMELVLTLIRLEELPEAKGIVQWFSDHGLLLNLIDKMNPNLDSDEHCIAQQCLCEIIRMSQTSLMDSPTIGPNNLIIELSSQKVMKKLVEYMLDKTAVNSTSTLINGVTILIDLIRHNNIDLNHETSFALVLGYPNQQQPTISFIPMLNVLRDHMGQFNSILLVKHERLGFERLKICELIAELLHCSNMSNLNLTLKNELNTPGDLLKLSFIENQILPTCIDLFFDFPWNNVLHYVIYDTLHQVFNGPMDKLSNQELALSIFNQGKLTQHILKAQELNDKECLKEKGSRLGYMGHLTFITDEIIKLFSSYPEKIKSRINIDFDTWQDYCSTEHEQTKQRNNLSLGESIKLTTVPYEEEEEEWFNRLNQEENSSAGLMVLKEEIYEQKLDWLRKDEEEEITDDPFGDFNASEEDIMGFTSNFSDIDINHLYEDQRKESLAQA